MSTVLVTGGSGFIASHTILQLLAAGYQVRTTVRSLEPRGRCARDAARTGERSRAISCRLSRRI